MRKINKHEYIKLIIINLIITIITCLSLGYATDILFAGNEVSYDNSLSGLTSTTVQGALDEMCTVADFSDRVSTLEGYFQNSPTSYFDDGDLRLGYYSTSGSPSYRIYDSNQATRTLLRYNSNTDKTYLAAYDSSGNYGGIEILGNPITINSNSSSGDINLNGNVKINGVVLTDRFMMDRIVTTSSPLEISVGNYSSLVIIGFAQGYGPLILGVTRNVNTLTVKNLMTNANFSSSYLTITLSHNKIVIATTANGNSVFTIIKGGV